MDIFEQWKKIEETKFDNSPIKKEDIMKAIYQDSLGTMETLKTRLKIKLNWIIFFIILFSGFMIYNYKRPDIMMIIGIVWANYAIGYFLIKRYYNRMGSDLSNMNTLQVMKKNYQNITKALSAETKFGYLTFPIVITCSILTSGLLQGMSFMQVVTSPSYMISIIGCLVVLVPLGMLMANKMNDSAFSEFTTKLKDNIQKMERV